MNRTPLAKKEIETILRHYRFDKRDVERLGTLQGIFEENLDRILEGFYAFILTFEHARAFLHSEEVLARHREGIKRWFRALVSGSQDYAYFSWLTEISEVHVKIGLPTHYVNAAISFVRNELDEILQEKGVPMEVLLSLNKILDINLDILSLSYEIEGRQQLLEEVVLIKQAIQEERVEVFVQPIYSVRDDRIGGYECLMRIKDPKSGEYPPIADLLRTAKSIHLYVELMDQMVEKSLEIFRELPWMFSMNLSYEDFNRCDFRKFLREKIRTFPDPERIVFEVLETDYIEDLDRARSFLEEIKDLGCRVAIDDFGSGYSNFENILKLIPDYLKIDGSLVEGVLKEEEKLILVENIVRMAHDMETEVVAEYVSSRELFELLSGMGVDYLQGYFIGKPFPATELLKRV